MHEDESFSFGWSSRHSAADQPRPARGGGRGRRGIGGERVHNPPTGAAYTPPIIEDEEDLCVLNVQGTFGLTGTLVGSVTFDLTAVQEAPCAEIAPLTFEGDGTYAGTVATAAGTFDFEVEGSVDALGNIEFQLEIEEGMGGLADLDGTLTFAGPPLGAITYSGQLEFDD